jgi:hypothetical protein
MNKLTMIEKEILKNILNENIKFAVKTEHVNDWQKYEKIISNIYFKLFQN